MAQVLKDAGRDAQIGLVRAHPELAGKAMVRKELTAESTNEQSKAGLTECTPVEFEKIQSLNAAYNQKFGWPFILAVRGPRGLGLNKHQIMATFERRLNGHPDFEQKWNKKHFCHVEYFCHTQFGTVCEFHHHSLFRSFVKTPTFVNNQSTSQFFGTLSTEVLCTPWSSTRNARAAQRGLAQA
jgi:OHCU decarboxylase